MVWYALVMGVCISDDGGVHRMLRGGTPLGRDRSSDKEQPAKTRCRKQRSVTASDCHPYN